MTCMYVMLITRWNRRHSGTQLRRQCFLATEGKISWHTGDQDKNRLHELGFYANKPMVRIPFSLNLLLSEEFSVTILDHKQFELRVICLKQNNKLLIWLKWYCACQEYIRTTHCIETNVFVDCPNQLSFQLNHMQINRYVLGVWEDSICYKTFFIVFKHSYFAFYSYLTWCF